MTESIRIGSRPSSHRVAGRPAVLDGLIPVLYGRLRTLALRHLRGEGVNPSLDPTALVHEAYMRLAALRWIDWQGRTHLLAMATAYQSVRN